MKLSPRNAPLLLAIPLIMLGIITLIAPYAKQLPDTIQMQLGVFPYLAILGTGVMGFVFRRYRFIYLAIILGVAYWNLQLLYSEPPANIILYEALFGLFFAINITLVNFLPEKRLFTLAGLGIFGALVGQLIVGKWVLTSFQEQLQGLLNYELDLLLGFVNTTGLNTFVLISFVLGGIILLGRFIQTRSVFESGFLGALTSVAFMMASNGVQPEASLFMLVTGLSAIGALVQNSYFIAYIDELTELPGRRALNEELSRLRGQYSIAMLDVDHFKKFNDTYGHDLGDQVLRMVGSKLANISGGGKAYRYGGEEFCVIYASKDMKACFPYLSSVRQAIDETRMIIRGKDRPKTKPDITSKRKRPIQEVHVTISIGIAEKCNELYSPEEVIKAADKALYVAKEKGRNRISQYGIKLSEQPISI